MLVVDLSSGFSNFKGSFFSLRTPSNVSEFVLDVEADVRLGFLGSIFSLNMSGHMTSQIDVELLTGFQDHAFPLHQALKSSASFVGASALSRILSTAAIAPCHVSLERASSAGYSALSCC